MINDMNSGTKKQKKKIIVDKCLMTNDSRISWLIFFQDLLIPNSFTFEHTHTHNRSVNDFFSVLNYLSPNKKKQKSHLAPITIWSGFHQYPKKPKKKNFFPRSHHIYLRKKIEFWLIITSVNIFVHIFRSDL